MAAIRAERAKKYEAEKQAEAKADSQAAGAAEETFEGAGKAWCFLQGKVGPATVGTKKMDMPQGDARNFYLGVGVTVLRNRGTGMTLELLDDSSGWFQLSAVEGAQVQLVSDKGDVTPSMRWYTPSLVEEAKDHPLKTASVKSAGMRSGNWKFAVEGRRLVVSNEGGSGCKVQLTEEGMFVLNEHLGEALHFQVANEPERMPLAEAQELLVAA